MGRRDYTLTRNDFRDHAMQTNDTGSRLTHDVCDFVQAQLGAKGSTLTWLDDAGAPLVSFPAAICWVRGANSGNPTRYPRK